MNKQGDFDEAELAGAVTKEFRKSLQVSMEDASVDLIVLDSFARLSDYTLEYNQIVHSGYDIYRGYNQDIRRILNRINATSPKPVIMTANDEVVLTETENEHLQERSRKCKIYGRELEGKIESFFTIVLFTKTEKQPNGKMEYSFLTNSDGFCSAKSPAGMFEELQIPNDLGFVMKRVREYYGGTEKPKKGGVSKPVVKRRA